MGKKDKNKKKGKGAEKTQAKTEKKLTNKLKKELKDLGEVWFMFMLFSRIITLFTCFFVVKQCFKGNNRSGLTPDTSCKNNTNLQRS